MTRHAIRRAGQTGSGSTENHAPGASPWGAGALRPLVTPDRRVLLLSILLQLALGLLFGHANDTRIFMATGYLVGSGHDPYVALNLSRVFHHAGFSVIASVGYPPPWPLLLGLIYRGVYAVVPQLLCSTTWPSSCP